MDCQAEIELFDDYHGRSQAIDISRHVTKNNHWYSGVIVSLKKNEKGCTK